jgi:hypothetical protein
MAAGFWFWETGKSMTSAQELVDDREGENIFRVDRSAFTDPRDI